MSENETLADVVAEIRAYGDRPPPKRAWLDIAERIEAIDSADAWRSLYSPGNAAEMREALETIHDKVNGLDEECGVDPVEIRDLARAALSAPPRNCDVGTAEEQENRFHTFCARWNGGVCIGCKVPVVMCECSLSWAQMPYEEKNEGATDGE